MQGSADRAQVRKDPDFEGKLQADEFVAEEGYFAQEHKGRESAAVVH